MATTYCGASASGVQHRHRPHRTERVAQVCRRAKLLHHARVYLQVRVRWGVQLVPSQQRHWLKGQPP